MGCGTDEAANASRLEELLTALLLQNQLNRPGIEYQHIDNPWSVISDDSSTGSDGPTASADNDQDEPPPF